MYACMHVSVCMFYVGYVCIYVFVANAGNTYRLAIVYYGS